MDANGILTVSATENATGRNNNITITNDKGRLTKEEIKKIVEEAEKHKEQDQQMKAAINARNELESYLMHMKTLVKLFFIFSILNKMLISKIIKQM